MSKVFQIPVTIAATAYVRADTEEAALSALTAKGPSIGLEIEPDHYTDIPISGEAFDSDELPDVSLSPAMTVYFHDMKQPLTVDDVSLAGE